MPGNERSTARPARQAIASLSFIRKGTAVLLDHGGGTHVWFILTDPDPEGKVLAVPLVTRKRHSDQACLLAKGEYDFKNPPDPREGAIFYSDCRTWPTNKLDSMIRNGEAVYCPAPDAALLERIIAGVLISGFTPQTFKDYLSAPP